MYCWDVLEAALRQQALGEKWYVFHPCIITLVCMLILTWYSEDLDDLVKAHMLSISILSRG